MVQQVPQQINACYHDHGYRGTSLSIYKIIIPIIVFHYINVIFLETAYYNLSHERLNPRITYANGNKIQEMYNRPET